MPMYQGTEDGGKGDMEVNNRGEGRGGSDRHWVIERENGSVDRYCGTCGHRDDSNDAGGRRGMGGIICHDSLR
jgi:hypothetical protein